MRRREAGREAHPHRAFRAHAYRQGCGRPRGGSATLSPMCSPTDGKGNRVADKAHCDARLTRQLNEARLSGPESSMASRFKLYRGLRREWGEPTNDHDHRLMMPRCFAMSRAGRPNLPPPGCGSRGLGLKQTRLRNARFVSGRERSPLPAVTPLLGSWRRRRGRGSSSPRSQLS